MKKLAGYADAILEASNKMGKLIDDLLDFSRLGRKEMQKKKVNLHIVVGEVVQEMREELKERILDGEIDKLPEVLGDESLLRLMMANLVSNAVKFTGTRSRAEIKITCKEEGDKFTCSVIDNGVGFDMKYADKLFEYSIVFMRRTIVKAQGMVLRNVRRIINRHGGKVWAEGAEGQGATFYFTRQR